MAKEQHGSKDKDSGSGTKKLSSFLEEINASSHAVIVHSVIGDLRMRISISPI